LMALVWSFVSKITNSNLFVFWDLLFGISISQ
jgi:hypothetical protein